MKKTLLTLSLFATFFSFSQVLQTDNFNTLVVGNVGTAFTGATAGQGSYFTQSSNGATPTTSSNAANTNYQVVSTGNSSTNGLTIVGPNGDKGSRFMWKNGLPTAWTGRTTGNDIIEIEVDINPGLASTSRNTFGVYIFDSTGGRILAGFTVRAATKEIFLVAYSTPGANPVNNYTYSLAAAPGIQLPSNAWSRIGISFNTVTGRALLKCPGIDPAGVFVDGSSPNTDPEEIDFISFSGHTATDPNSAAGSMVFDNFVARASATDTLLSNDSFNFGNNSSIVIYPNPAKEILNIKSEVEVLTKVSITDLNGRVVKEVTNNLSQISLSGLAKGIYLVNIESETAKKVEKLIIE